MPALVKTSCCLNCAIFNNWRSLAFLHGICEVDPLNRAFGKETEEIAGHIVGRPKSAVLIRQLLPALQIRTSSAVAGHELTTGRETIQLIEETGDSLFAILR
jgi:hypothetical protein